MAQHLLRPARLGQPFMDERDFHGGLLESRRKSEHEPDLATDFTD
jgi:hypothetical protein